MEGFLSQAVVYLAAAVIAVPIASRMGLGSVLDIWQQDRNWPCHGACRF